ncbi:MAG: PTS sugar transporter subunit IIC [Proteobacteria bacterium]|nr:PTS sugar transporter subunit IIC [Pseudomonadota bacterium]MBU2567574.1 PTS sugar transporter subunit IIC [Elusimicrobiota bacterium]
MKYNNVLFFAFLSSLLGLDVTAVAQTMVSRPIVAASIAGYLLGDLKTGVLIGAVIELVWIRVIPVGAVPPDTTVSSLLATFWCIGGAAQGGGLTPGVMENSRIMLSILMAIPFGMVFKKLDIVHRQFNTSLVHLVDREVEKQKYGIISKAVFLGATLFWLKAFVFYGLLFYPGALAVNFLEPALSGAVKSGLDTAFKLIPAAGIVAAFSMFSKRKHEDVQPF